MIVSFSSTRTHGTGNDFFEVLSRTFAESKFNDSPPPIDENVHAKNYDYHYDSDLEDDGRPQHWESNGEGSPSRGTRHQSSLLSTLDDKSPSPTNGELIEPPTKGAIVDIHDVAFIMYVSSRESHCAP